MEQKSKSNKAALIWSIVGFLILGGFAAFIVSKKDQIQPFGTPIQSVEFESGDVFHLYQAEFSQSMRLEYHKPKFSVSGSGSGGSSNNFLSYRLERTGDRLTAATVQGRQTHGVNAANLILVGRMVNPTGDPLIPKVISTPSYYPGDPRQLEELSWNGSGDFEDIDESSRTKRDGYWIEVEDGSDGWLPLIGPIVFQQNDGRSVSLRQSFPRLQEELKLKIFTEDGEAKVINIPNPGFSISTASATWTADPKPWKKSYIEFDLELNGFKEAVTDDGGRILIPRPEWTLIPHDSSLPPKMFWPQMPKISDEIGNSGQIHRFPGAKLVRFEGVVARSRDEYPWKIADTIPILEYRVNKKGEVALTLLPKSSDYYLTEAKHSGGEINLIGKGPSGYSKPQFRGLIVFEKGKAVSKQVLRYGGGGSSGGMKFTEFDLDFDGKLPAGTEGTLAFPDLPHSIPYDFTIPMDDIPGLSNQP